MDELGTFPTSVLVNVRTPIKFVAKESIADGIDYGELSFDENEPLWIVDGQHRLEALKRAMASKPEFAEYPLPVSILNLETKFEEMLHFYLVNSRQRKIPTNLVYRQLQVMVNKIVLGEKEWLKEIIVGPAEERQAMAAFIVDFLESEEGSPFQGKLQFMGEEKEPHHLLSDEMLTRYTAKILTEKAYAGMGYERVAEMLADYWNAIKELFPDCFENPGKYTLLKSTGVASFTYLFPTIFAYCAADGQISKSCMKKYLTLLQEKTPDPQLSTDFQKSITEDWWSRAHGPSIASATSEKVFSEISKSMAKKIEIGLRGSK
jgi:DGQHR domain-containing protein